MAQKTKNKQASSCYSRNDLDIASILATPESFTCRQRTEVARINAGIEENTDVAYSDDEATAGLLSDEKTGLRGRPDQIVIVDGEFIPVEQKLVKYPKNHTNRTRCSYLHIYI